MRNVHIIVIGWWLWIASLTCLTAEPASLAIFLAAWYTPARERANQSLRMAILPG
jgi:hypothetical protein